MIFVIVHLYIAPGMRSQFHGYEQAALACVRRHGGELVTAFAPECSGDNDDCPDEVHVIRFPDRIAFDAFRSDPAIEALSKLRAQCISKTALYLSDIDIAY